MASNRACLLLGLVAGVLLAAGGGCAGSTTSGGDEDTGVGDGGGPDRAVQQDAPPFFQDTAPLPDGYERPDGWQDDGGLPDDAGGQQDAGACYPEPDEASGGDTCVDAIDKGSLKDNTSSHVVISGNLWPGGDVDWYKVSFIDEPDDSGGSDKFNARIKFSATGNPGNAYAFDVLLGDCATAPTCGTAGDSHLGTTEFKWDASGEAPCRADPVNTLPGFQVCSDNSMVLKIRVFRVSGSPACESYELELDNGPP